MKNTINWFEIPTRDMDKAVRFYEAALATTIKRETFGGVPHGVFPHANGTVTGALVADGKRQPGATGALIYFDCADGVPAVLDRATKAGAKMVLPVTAIGEHGWIAVVADLDGNEIGLHAPPAAG
jgi:predicted enzyme related to lactoylglutathione lyase